MATISYDLLWARFTRAVSFVLGVGIMAYETVGDHSDRPWLYAAAIGMMGLPVTRAAEEIITRFSGTEHPHVIPPRKQSEEEGQTK